MNAEPLRWFNTYSGDNQEIRFRGFPSYHEALKDSERSDVARNNDKREGLEVEGPYSAREVLQRFGSSVFDEQRSSTSSFHQIASYLRDEPLTNNEKMEKAFAYGAASAEFHYSTYAASIENALGVDQGAVAARADSYDLMNRYFQEGLVKGPGTHEEKNATKMALGASAAEARLRDPVLIRNGGHETSQDFIRDVHSKGPQVVEWLAQKRPELRPALLGKDGLAPPDHSVPRYANPDKEMAIRHPEVFRAAHPQDVANNLTKQADKYFFRAEGIRSADQAFRAGWDASKHQMGRYVDSLERAAGLDTERPFDAAKFNERHLNNMYRTAYLPDNTPDRAGVNTPLREGMREFAINEHDKVMSREARGVEQTRSAGREPVREHTQHLERHRDHARGR